MAGDVAVYARLVGSRIRSQLQYRVSFALQAGSSLLVTAMDFLGVAILFRHVPHLAGWSLAEMTLLFGLTHVAFKAAQLVVGHLDNLPEYVRTGQFDSMLVRPLGSLPGVLTQDVSLRHAGGFLQAGVIFAAALAGAPVPWDPGRIALVPVFLAAGFVIHASIWVATNTISFWLVGAREAANAFTYGGSVLSSFPLPVFGAWLRRIVVFLVPVAFVNYFPAVLLLDKPAPHPGALGLASPAVAAAAALAAGAVWRAGVRHYRSTGS